MHGSIERRTVRFGGRNLTGAVSYCGSPSLAGGAVAPGPDVAALTASGYLPTNTLEQASQRLDLQPKGGHSIRGIGIAPDSAIHSCRVVLAGKNGETDTHQISPGNPLLGCLDGYDFAYLSLPNSIPGIANADGVTWDGAPNGSLDGYPLRLELFRGDVLPMRSHKRAPYFAHAIFEIAASGTRILYVCVDGRERVDVIVNGSAGVSTITIDAIEARKVTAQPLVDNLMAKALEVDDVGNTSFIAATGSNCSIVSFQGNPITIMAVNIAQTSATGIVQVKVKAYD